LIILLYILVNKNSLVPRVKKLAPLSNNFFRTPALKGKPKNTRQEDHSSKPKFQAKTRQSTHNVLLKVSLHFNNI